MCWHPMKLEASVSTELQAILGTENLQYIVIMLWKTK